MRVILEKQCAAMTIRNRIKELVDSRGLSIYRFWQDTGISRNTAYELYHHPERYPMAEVMEAICRAYGVTPGDVLEYAPDRVSGPEVISGPESGPTARPGRRPSSRKTV
jgi:DNA-binding Xre family transcriptional regulator